MGNKPKIVILIIITFIIIGWNNEVVETRREVHQTEPVKITGLDYDRERPDNVILTIVRDEMINAGQGGGGGNNNGSSGEGQQKHEIEEVVSISATTFVKASRVLQTYMDKQIPGGHIKYVMIGEDIARDDIKKAVDFATRNEELRLGSSVYIAKDATARDFLREAATKDYKLSDKINNMEEATRRLYLYNPVDLAEVLKLSIIKGRAGVIPSLEVVDYNKEDIEDFNISTKKEDNTNVFFGGYAVIKDAKLIDFLTLDMSRGYNFVKNKLRTTSIDTKTENGAKINLNVTNSNCKIDFEFNGDELTKAIIKVRFRSNFTEIDSDEEVFQRKNIKFLENAQSTIVKNEIESVVLESQRLNADFLDLKGSLNFSHPYKYKKLEDKWNEIFPSMPVEVIVESQILRTYDIVNPSKQGGE